MATIADIAKRAGVSVSTVSYVLSGKRPISAATKQRVLAAIAELDFRPHALGRALASRRTRTIAVHYPLVAAGLTEFHLDFFTAAAATASAHGYAFMLSTAAVDEADLLDLTRSGAIDGLILMEVRLHDPRVALLRERQFPFTLIGHGEQNDGISFVDFDFVEAVRGAVAHLARLRHRHLGLVHGTPRQLAAGYGPAVRALAGFERALAEHEVSGTVIPCEPAYEAGLALARRLATDFPELTAAIVPNNDALGGLVAGTYEMGRRIPHDLSLVAMAPRRLARLFTPTMTTIDFPAVEMGRRGAEMLIRRLEGGGEPFEQFLLRGELIVGRSTARSASIEKERQMQATTLTRRRAIKGAAGGLLGTALVATSPRRSFARQENVTLRWWDYYAEGANATAMQNQLQRYMDANPQVTIERTAIPFADLKQKLLQGAAAGELPDVAVIDNPDHQAFAALGILEDLTERVSAWGQADAYFAGPWDSTIWQERNYGIPDNSNCLVLWSNTAFTSPAEVAPPTNWEELRAAAAALTEGDRMGLAVCAVKSEEGAFQWLPFLWEAGEDIPTIDAEGGQRALQLWVDLVNEGFMSKGILGWTQQDVRIQFQNGKAAMMINGPWQIPTLQAESPDLQWEVTTLPEDVQQASILGGENYSIVKGGPNVDAAWDLLVWTQQPENLKPYLTEAGKLPSRQDLAEDAYWTGDPVLAVFIEQLKVAKPRAYGSHYPEISSAIQEAIQAAVSGQAPVADALARAKTTVTPLLP